MRCRSYRTRSRFRRGSSWLPCLLFLLGKSDARSGTDPCASVVPPNYGCPGTPVGGMPPTGDASETRRLDDCELCVGSVPDQGSGACSDGGPPRLPVQAQLAVHVAHVTFDRPDAHEQLPRDRLVRHAGCYAAEDFGLACGQQVLRDVVVAWQARQERVELAEEDLPCRLVREEDVVASLQRHETRTGDGGRHQPSLFERHGGIVMCVQHQRGGDDLSNQVGDVDLLPREPHLRCGRRRCGHPLQLVEPLHLFRGRVRDEQRRKGPAERRAFTTLFVPDATHEQMEWFDELQRMSTSAATAAQMRLAREEVDVTDLVGQVVTPTLVLHAHDDAAVPFEQGRLVASAIPGARFVPLEGRNHILLADEPAWEVFLRELDAFLPSLPSDDDVAKDLLTARETEILRGVAAGMTNQAIARQLFVSVRTVERHMGNMYGKLGLHGKSGRAAIAARAASLIRDRPDA